MAIYLLSLNIQHFIGHSVADHHNIYIRRTDHKIVHSGENKYARECSVFYNFIAICKFNSTVKCFMLVVGWSMFILLNY